MVNPIARKAELEARGITKDVSAGDDEAVEESEMERGESRGLRIYQVHHALPWAMALTARPETA